MFDFLNFGPDALQSLITYVGYPGVTFMVFAESGLPFGFIFPGSSMLFTAGILASQGFFNIWILLVLVTMAAICGDLAGYWMGGRIGQALYKRPDSKWFKHEHLEQARSFYDDWGVYTVLFGRFLPVVRTFIPIVAGIAKMNFTLFLVYNILGALIWATGVTFAGFFLGRKFPAIEEHLTVFVLAIIILSSLPVFIKAFREQMKKEVAKESVTE